MVGASERAGLAGVGFLRGCYPLARLGQRASERTTLAGRPVGLPAREGAGSQCNPSPFYDEYRKKDARRVRHVGIEGSLNRQTSRDVIVTAAQIEDPDVHDHSHERPVRNKARLLRDFGTSNWVPNWIRARRGSLGSFAWVANATASEDLCGRHSGARAQHASSESIPPSAVVMGSGLAASDLGFTRDRHWIMRTSATADVRWRPGTTSDAVG